MALLQSKQIKKELSSFVGVNSFTTSASSSDIVTSEISTTLATASNAGTSVPVQPSLDNFTEGVITTPVSNRVEIQDATTKDKLVDVDGNEIYGRITESTGVYTLSYFVNDAGTETAYTFTSATDIDFLFAYRFSFNNLPADAIIRNKSSVADDPSGRGGGDFVEQITVTGLNTLSNLSQTPIGGSIVKLFVNGKAETELAGGAFSRTGVSLTWNPTNAMYNVETTDNVVASYPIAG